MRVLFLADVRSPTAKNWISYFVDKGHDVSVIATYPCVQNSINGATLFQVPIAFSRLSRSGRDSYAGGATRRSLIDSSLDKARSGSIYSLMIRAWAWLSPIEIHRHVGTIRRLINDLCPDIVHAMRIPFEGIVGAMATPLGTPLVVSVWGNDFTWIGAQNPLIGAQTKRVVNRADALVCDNSRDLRLAIDSWHFDSKKLSAVMPGAGGVQPSLFYPGLPAQTIFEKLNLDRSGAVVVNPRGFRGYVDNDAFFHAIPKILREMPDTTFLCCAMKDNPSAQRMVNRLNIANSVRLLPLVARDEMGELFRLAKVSISPSIHDGTPNSLIEAMACGCFPVVGDLESLREWIVDGENGLLCDATKPDSIAESILRALRDKPLRDRATEINLRLVQERADYSNVMSQAEAFYDRVVHHRQSSATRP